MTGIGVISAWSLAGSLLEVIYRQRGVAVFAVTMVLFGTLVEIVTVARFVQYKRSIARIEFAPSPLVYQLVTFGFLILGAAYIIYVVLT